MSKVTQNIDPFDKAESSAGKGLGSWVQEKLIELNKKYPAPDSKRKKK